jgi:YjbE family integral membrane protein|tara:strand:- start:834 stop:1457 length:624 start_codon:yes stop_codon:yes gene_type:complete
MTLEQPIILLQIIFIDIVMAADNAIIIGLIAANYSPNNRKKIIAFGVAAAFIFRVIFALSATYLLTIAWMKILGGVLLIWVINNLRQDLFVSKKIRSPRLQSKESKTFGMGVYQVLVADITLSLDNVLGVAGAAKNHFSLLVFGLLLSVVLIGTLASYFATYIKNHRWLGWVGIGIILIVAMQLIVGGLANLGVISINESFKNLFHV